MKRIFHRIAHWIGWNCGRVETWHDKTGRLMVGFRCECGAPVCCEPCCRQTQTEADLAASRKQVAELTEELAKEKEATRKHIRLPALVPVSYTELFNRVTALEAAMGSIRDTAIAMIDSLRTYKRPDATVILVEGPQRIKDKAVAALETRYAPASAPTEKEAGG